MVDFMKKYEVKPGMKIYDDLNGRYITVVEVDHFSNQVAAQVTETTCDEDGNDTGEVTETVLFTVQAIAAMATRYRII